MALDPILSSLLSEDMSNFKEKPVLPESTYYATIKDFGFGKSSQKGTRYVQFNFSGLSPSEEVAEECTTLGIDFSKYNNLNYKFYLTEDSRVMLKNFFTSLGLEVAGKGISEVLPMVAGASVQLSISKSPSSDGKREFNRVEEVSSRQD